MTVLVRFDRYLEIVFVVSSSSAISIVVSTIAMNRVINFALNLYVRSVSTILRSPYFRRCSLQ